jgi:hypothetical protein
VNVALSLATLAAVALALGFAGRMGFGALRGGRSRASGVLGLALALSAGLEALDLLCVLFPQEMPLWRSAGLVVEGAMCPAWVWFTALFARDYEDGRLPALQRGLIAGASLMLPWGA